MKETEIKWFGKKSSEKKHSNSDIFYLSSLFLAIHYFFVSTMLSIRRSLGRWPNCEKKFCDENDNRMHFCKG